MGNGSFERIRSLQMENLCEKLLQFIFRGLVQSKFEIAVGEFLVGELHLPFCIQSVGMEFLNFFNSMLVFDLVYCVNVQQCCKLHHPGALF